MASRSQLDSPPGGDSAEKKPDNDGVFEVESIVGKRIYQVPFAPFSRSHRMRLDRAHFCVPVSLLLVA